MKIILVIYLGVMMIFITHGLNKVFNGKKTNQSNLQ